MLRPGQQSKGAVTPGMIREALDRQGSFTFRAWGGSMMPVVRHGAMIRIEPFDAGRARAGDILFFATPDGRYIGHRFLRWSSGEGDLRLMLTSGDTLPHCDPPHRTESLLGRVSAIRRGNREILLRRGARSRLMAAASSLSCRVASPLLSLASLLPDRLDRASRPVIRCLACGPVFVLGALLRN